MISPLNPSQTASFVSEYWDSRILPTLSKYITIPNLSPAFDPDWLAHGHLKQAAELLSHWIQEQHLSNLSLEMIELANRTPLLFIEVQGDTNETVLLYGHMDKQPPLTGWSDGLDPFTPVIKDGKLFGRGSADDGYSTFAAITAIKTLQAEGVQHPRCIILIEACEESGSLDLPAIMEYLGDRIGTPKLIIGLDSGCGNYEQLWVSTSLRGIVSGILRVNILNEGVHSGDASGIVPSSFRILRSLLSRIEDEQTGRILVEDCWVEIPKKRQTEAEQTAAVLGLSVGSHFPFVVGAHAASSDPLELLFNQSWRPMLAVIGAEGLPEIQKAGNVLRASTAVKLSLRIPPTCDANQAGESIKKILEEHPPYGARVTFDLSEPMRGWNAPPMAEWLTQSLQTASKQYFGKEPCSIGIGGSIPFMGMLGERFPEAQFLITGVLGPGSNAHGPNEFLHLETAKKLTCCVAQVIAETML